MPNLRRPRRHPRPSPRTPCRADIPAQFRPPRSPPTSPAAPRQLITSRPTSCRHANSIHAVPAHADWPRPFFPTLSEPDDPAPHDPRPADFPAPPRSSRADQPRRSCPAPPGPLRSRRAIPTRAWPPRSPPTGHPAPAPPCPVPADRPSLPRSALSAPTGRADDLRAYPGKMTVPRPAGARWDKFRQLVFATFGDVCIVCSHGGARTIDHLKSVTEFPELAWDLNNCRPIHGLPYNRCLQCRGSGNCNGIKGGYSLERAQKIIAERNGRQASPPLRPARGAIARRFPQPPPPPAPDEPGRPW